MSRWYMANTQQDLVLFYTTALPKIRAAARELGYAIGLHGSMTRDLDLMAVPWVDEHGTKDDLAAAVQYAACGMTASSFAWHEKPCGRIATSLCICWTADKRPSAGHIDLSVMGSNAELTDNTK